MAMNFSQIGLDEDDMDVPMDEAGQPLDSPRLIAKQGVCVCVCVCVCVHTHVCVCTHMCVHIYIHTYIHT